jgi:hypothetical protein
MGGLFSSSQKDQETPTSPGYSSSYQPSPHPFRISSDSTSSYARPQNQDYTSAQFDHNAFLQLREEERRRNMERDRQRYVIPVSSRPLHRAVLQHPLAVNWIPMPSNSAFIKTDVQNTQEYRRVSQLFKKTTQKRFKVNKLERIQNPYLLGCYLLKKKEMECHLGSYVKEERVFHGTKQSNVDSICENNFDWRRHGGMTGNRYGKGVSFSPISYYASHYSDKHSTVKVMFVARVLISNITEGHGDMTIPPLMYHSYDHNNTLRYDTTQKENGHVIVKFCDNEYYPEYLIYYTVKPDIRNRNGDIRFEY